MGISLSLSFGLGGGVMSPNASISTWTTLNSVPVVPLAHVGS